MCTLIAAVKQFDAYPLVIAANRDERMDRPSSPLMLWAGARPFLAPRDDEGGGTWLGMNPSGLFVGITNRFGAPRNSGLKSRGLIVTRALESGGARQLREDMGRLKYEEFNPFHLLYADREEAFVSWFDGRGFFHESLAPGLHIVTERSLGGDDKARTELIRNRWPYPAFDSIPEIEPLIALLRLHGDEPGSGTCVHVPELNYGTRSSMVLLLSRTWDKSRLFWADGQPCTSPYRDESRYLLQLKSAARP